MLLSVLQIHGNLFWRMSGIIDLEAVDRNFLAELIKQGYIIASKFPSPSRMGDETDASTAMSGINDSSNVVRRKKETTSSDQIPERCCSCSITMFFSASNLSTESFRARFF